jgi:hypothetical protein
MIDLRYKTCYLNEEVNCTEPSRSVSLPWTGRAGNWPLSESLFMSFGFFSFPPKRHSDFGPKAIWPKSNLAQSNLAQKQFSPKAIWPKSNLAQKQFGPKAIWPKSNFAQTTFPASSLKLPIVWSQLLTKRDSAKK